MKHTNFSFILVLFFSLLQPLCTAEQQLVFTAELPPTQQFVEYLGNVASVLMIDEDQSQEKKDFIRSHTAKTAALMGTVDELLGRSAFTRSPGIKIKLYAIFKKIDVTAWPSKVIVRSLKNDLSEYKKYLMASYVAQLSTSSASQDLDREAIAAVIVLLDELDRFVLTSEFFDFSFLDSVVDTFMVRPAEFVKAHPYLTIGGVVFLATAGGVGYYYWTKYKEAKVTALQKFLQEHDAQLVLGSQKAADCGVKALYAAWCSQAAEGDLDKYKNLFCDKDRYERFKGTTKDLMQAHADAVRRPGKKRRIVSTNWLENDDIERLLGQFDQAADDKQEFGFKVDDNALLFVHSRVDLQPEKIAGDVRYRDRELVDADGDPRFYCEDNLPDDRVDHCDEVRQGGLRHDMKKRIEKFRAKDGNKFDFIINTNVHSAKAYEALKEGKDYEPENQGHFFHVRAINDADAQEGVRFVVTETFAPKVKVIDPVLSNLRNLLRPFDE